MLEIGDSAGISAHSADLLNRIAKALVIPSKAFSEPSLCDLAQTAELLQLWAMIEHEQDRLKVLAIIHSITADVDQQSR